ncbi:hypothetical protein WN51_01713 [Melipona quadrifasciata]|uniref:Uncharacterized protein n=1 Tax=Melipona quadrifasciata TaxID=166423 RepID=A0A0M8ZX83_9HYME|nr:hypothetical protein WN51_01713 [Melipona quadrifasciata]
MKILTDDTLRQDLKREIYFVKGESKGKVSLVLSNDESFAVDGYCHKFISTDYTSFVKIGNDLAHLVYQKSN